MPLILIKRWDPMQSVCRDLKFKKKKFNFFDQLRKWPIILVHFKLGNNFF